MSNICQHLYIMV